MSWLVDDWVVFFVKLQCLVLYSVIGSKQVSGSKVDHAPLSVAGLQVPSKCDAKDDKDHHRHRQ